jgi:hypothetical protein
MAVVQQLKQALSGLRLFSDGIETIELDSEGKQLRLDLAALDGLACAFTKLTLSSPKLADASLAALKTTAEALSKRLTYLLEPISPIETDSEGWTVQMRSMPPHSEENVISYYELLVSREGRLSLVRFQRTSGSPRERIAAQVTREVLCRLVSDMSAVA